MGLKMKMKRGELVGFQGCLGYDYDKETKELFNNEEAEVVRFIFESIVEKIILSDINDKGQKPPKQLTFVLKTGSKSTISIGKEDDSDNVKGFLKKGKELYYYVSPDTRSSCALVDLQ